MHVILLILKIIGIILLVILGILLVLLLLFLFVPLRYRLHICKNGELKADGRMTWLLHLLRADLNYQDRKAAAVVRVFGFRVKSFHFPKKEETSAKDEAPSKDGALAKDEASSKNETSAKDEASSKNETPGQEVQPEESAGTLKIEESAEDAGTAADIGLKPEDAKKAADTEMQSEDEKPSGNRSLFEKLKQKIRRNSSGKSSSERNSTGKRGSRAEKKASTPGFLGRVMELTARLINLGLELLLRVPDLPAEVYDKIDQVQEKIHEKIGAIHKKIDPFLSIEAEHMLPKFVRYLRYLIRGYAPRKIRGYIHFGTWSPDTTGKLTGLIYVLLPEAGTEYDVDPDFYEEVLETDTEIIGHIRMYRFAWVGIRLVFDREFWSLLRQIRGREKNSGHRGSKRARRKALKKKAQEAAKKAA